jgi:hypothetical protein
MSTPSSRSPSESGQPLTTESTGLPRLRGVVLPFRAVNRLPEHPDLADEEAVDLSLRRQKQLTPALPVRVIGGPKAAVLPPFWGIIDSGATRTLLPWALAKRLGIRKRNCGKERVHTAGGWVRQYVWSDGLEVEFPELSGHRMHVVGAFIKNGPPFILLGRRDFFNHFRVTIDEPAQAFGIEPHLHQQ